MVYKIDGSRHFINHTGLENSEDTFNTKYKGKHLENKYPTVAEFIYKTTSDNLNKRALRFLLHHKVFFVEEIGMSQHTFKNNEGDAVVTKWIWVTDPFSADMQEIIGMCNMGTTALYYVGKTRDSILARWGVDYDVKRADEQQIDVGMVLDFRPSFGTTIDSIKLSPSAELIGYMGNPSTFLALFRYCSSLVPTLQRIEVFDNNVAWAVIRTGSTADDLIALNNTDDLQLKGLKKISNYFETRYMNIERKTHTRYGAYAQDSFYDQFFAKADKVTKMWLLANNIVFVPYTILELGSRHILVTESPFRQNHWLSKEVKTDQEKVTEIDAENQENALEKITQKYPQELFRQYDVPATSTYWYEDIDDDALKERSKVNLLALSDPTMTSHVLNLKYRSGSDEKLRNLLYYRYYAVRFAAQYTTLESHYSFEPPPPTDREKVPGESTYQIKDDSTSLPEYIYKSESNDYYYKSFVGGTPRQYTKDVDGKQMVYIPRSSLAQLNDDLQLPPNFLEEDVNKKVQLVNIVRYLRNKQRTEGDLEFDLFCYGMSQVLLDKVPSEEPLIKIYNKHILRSARRRGWTPFVRLMNTLYLFALLSFVPRTKEQIATGIALTTAANEIRRRVQRKTEEATT